MKIIKTLHKIINGDSRLMSELQNKSIHLVITSPPYWQLKDYGAHNQIGFDGSYESYINNISGENNHAKNITKNIFR